MKQFHLPVRPYSPIDALNRRAVAVGSLRYAMLASHADYNGHQVTLSWNNYRKYYVAEYFWAGRVVIARGDFRSCLAAVLGEYDRGALGSSASINPREDDLDAIEACESNPRISKGDLWKRDQSSSQLKTGDWWTWRHDAAIEAARDMANPRSLVLIFDWPLMQAANDRQEYEIALKSKYGKVYQ